jgi:hypothetical protein
MQQSLAVIKQESLDEEQCWHAVLARPTLVVKVHDRPSGSFDHS